MNSPSKFTVVSTFSGCGGSSLGYSLAGGKVLLAVEWDKSAAAIYRANLPDTPIYHGDIGKLTAAKCMQLAGIKPRELDVFDGSPPCQGFSLAGRRQLGDKRNQLFLEYVRLLKALQPRVFVMENVAGMVIGKMRLIFAEIMRKLKSCGYRVKARVLNAACHDVPQIRRRIIFIGVRNDLGIDPSYPAPTSRVRTVREAIGHLPIGSPGKHSDRVKLVWSLARPGEALREVVPNVGSFQVVRLDPNKPSPTLMHGGVNWHYAVCRKLTLAECAILQSFPEDFAWPVSQGKAREKIGNSVPPLLMKAIAANIRDNILNKTKRPKCPKTTKT